MGSLVWKIVIPDTLFSSDEGLLCGFLLTSREFICVSSVTKYEKYFSSTSGNAKQFQCLGYWHGTKFKDFTFEDRESVNTARQESMVWVDIYLSAEGRPHAVFRFRDSLRTDPLQIGVATCLVFNPSELLSSYILRDVDQRVLLKSSKDPNEDMTTNLGTLVYVLHQHLLQNSTKKAQNEATRVKDLIQKCSQRGFAGVCVLKIAAFLSWVYFALGKLLDNRFMDNQYLKPVVNHVAFFHQIELRYLQVKQCNNMAPTEKLQEIRCLNVKTRLILDMVLGLLLMMFLMWSGAADVTAAYIITWANAVVVWLNQLLDWLMGVPAGLKLNSQLDQFLGRFFHYHIYLWTGYLSLLKPVLSPLLWYASMVGVLGLSAQLCLLQDIFSTLTVHIYCFYVYAARLYYFQLYGLSSMWRLFRGKKWNVLRRRVDSASYDVDQLFVGTLLFTILLFLLPTTALYYVVFLGLRLLVLSLTGMVSKAVSLINTLPIHMLLLRLFRSPKAAGDVMLTVLPHQGQRENLFVALQTIQVPFSHLISSLTDENARIDSLPRYTWASLLRRVLAGELIYPWVEPAVQSRKLQ